IGITAFQNTKTLFFNDFERKCFLLKSAPETDITWINDIISAIRYSSEIYHNTSKVKRDKVVIAIHGIRTYGEWQSKLENTIITHETKVNFMPYKYGVFSIISFFIPFVRYIHVYFFYKNLINNKEFIIDKDIYIFSHSFGTYIVSCLLKDFKKIEYLNLKCLVLAGSVLKSNFDWSSALEKYHFQLINDCGLKDNVLLLSQFLVPGVGMAGRTGFIGLNNGVMINRFFNGGHDLYFKSENFMKENWLPCIYDNKISFADNRQSKFYTPALSLILDLFGFIKYSIFLILLFYLIASIIDSFIKI
ncbi:MAG TPA: hypothetical protein PLM98_07075, partial [Thiolinea sp.]|nr:hypothetical protein [Thiolinea sp.]